MLAEMWFLYEVHLDRLRGEGSFNAGVLKMRKALAYGNDEARYFKCFCTCLLRAMVGDRDFV